MSGATTAAILELVAGGEALPVASFGADAVSLRGTLSAASAKLERFTLSITNGASRIRVPFRGSVTASGADVVVDPVDRQRILSAAAAGLTLDPARMQGLVTPVPPARRAIRRRNSGQLLALIVCIVLGAYVGIRLWDKVTTIEPHTAWLATEATTILSPTSGRISFIESEGRVESGQPAVGIETTSGKSLLIDAPGNGEVVSAEKAVGDRVKRGDPLLAYAQPEAPLYLHAVVDREQAFRLAAGTHVRYARLDAPSDAVAFDARAADLIVRALPFDGRQHLYEVRVPVPATGEQHRALPVSLRFEQDFVASLSESLRGIGLLTGLPVLNQGETR